MRSIYKQLREYIKIVDVRNENGKEDNLLGVSVTKVFIDSIANTIGTDFTTYRLVKKNQFTYIPDTSRRGDKIGIALLEDREEGIVSQAYTVFEIVDIKKLLPQYLMMWFRRTEFDRYARYMSYGSVREIFSWEEMCNVELPVPHIDKQREIVKEYNTIVNRIELNDQLIQRLEATAQTIYKQWFVDFEFPDENGSPYKSSGGEMVESELGEIPKGWKLNQFTQVVKLTGGGTPDTTRDSYWNGEYPFFTPADIQSNYYCTKTEKLVTKLGLQNSSTKLYPKNTVFVTARGTVGAIALAGCEMTMNQSCYALSGQFQFFIHQLTIAAIAKLKNEASGAVFSALVTKDFDEQIVIQPDKEIEEKFQKRVNGLYNFIFLKSQENDQLKNLQNLNLSKIATLEK
jgi:type I restriction enzyme S subunit